MFGKKFQRKYALTDQGVKNMKQATFWTVIVNLVVMGGMGILYLMMTKYMDTLTGGSKLPKASMFIALVLLFVVLSLITHMQQYRATYGLVYGEVKNVRISLAERMRKLPLGYFGKRDLADLTETIMGDVNRLEHVWSHCIGYLYGSYISTAIVAIMVFAFEWRMALACLWGVPVAFGLLFGSRRISKRNSEITKEAGIQVSDGIQETLENIREIRATNQEEKFIKELNDKIDYHEKTMLSGELSCGIFVNGAKLSGGERQRISIARALLKNAPIVLLDEATASLDVENETKVQGALSRLLAGKTVLVIAHRMRTVEAADKIVVLADGKVVEEGKPSELLKKNGSVFKRMAKLQSESAGWSLVR